MGGGGLVSCTCAPAEAASAQVQNTSLTPASVALKLWWLVSYTCAASESYVYILSLPTSILYMYLCYINIIYIKNSAYSVGLVLAEEVCRKELRQLASASTNTCRGKDV